MTRPALPRPDDLPAVPDGLTVRPVDLPADAAGVEALVSAVEAAYVTHPADPAHRVVDEFAELLADGGACLVVERQDGALAGLASFQVADAAPDAPEPLLFPDCYVHPGHAGTLEDALLGWTLARARAWVADDGRRARVSTGVQREDVALAAAATALGLQRVRTFWRMERPLGPDAAVAPEPPPGVVVRRAAGPDDHVVVHRLREESFAEHWGHRPETFEQWFTRVTRSVTADPTQRWLAELDGEPVGFCLGEHRGLAGDAGGYVRTLGVVAAARGRGVARHLLRVAFAEHARRGWAWTQLTVDSENATGATALYRSVGMEPVEVIDAWETRIVAEPTTRVPE